VDSDGLEGRFFGYLQRLLSFDNSSFGITPNNNNNINFKVPTPKSVVEDASLDFISNFDQDKALDTVQNGLDVAGVFFDPADALNGTISLARGNYVDAGLNFVSVVPLVGDAIGKGGKMGKKIVKNTSDISKAIKIADKSQKTIVIGESMSRVKKATKMLQKEGIDAKWYQAWSKNFPKNGVKMTSEQLSQALSRNARWLKSKIDEGYQIIDIGKDINRMERSAFFDLEQDIIENANDLNLIKVDKF